MNEGRQVASVHMCTDSSSNKVTYPQVLSTMHTGTVS